MDHLSKRKDYGFLFRMKGNVIICLQIDFCKDNGNKSKHIHQYIELNSTMFDSLVFNHETLASAFTLRGEKHISGTEHFKYFIFLSPFHNGNIQSVISEDSCDFAWSPQLTMLFRKQLSKHGYTYKHTHTHTHTHCKLSYYSSFLLPCPLLLSATIQNSQKLKDCNLRVLPLKSFPFLSEWS